MKGMIFLKTIREKVVFFPREKFFLLTKNILLVSSFAFLTALGAKIKIEIGLIPFTFQTFFVLASGVFLGAKKGALSQMLYIFLGLIGFPYFARGGGFSYLFSPTFGYLLGFVISSFLAGFLTEKRKNYFLLFLSLLLANFSLYLFGLPWLSFFLQDFKKAILLGFLPFWLSDTLKVILLWLILINKNFLRKVAKNLLKNV